MTSRPSRGQPGPKSSCHTVSGPAPSSRDADRPSDGSWPARSKPQAPMVSPPCCSASAEDGQLVPAGGGGVSNGPLPTSTASTANGVPDGTTGSSAVPYEPSLPPAA